MENIKLISRKYLKIIKVMLFFRYVFMILKLNLVINVECNLRIFKDMEILYMLLIEV